ncbi:hypothetical protein MIV066L [Invertebrate iridescent virus 3]|uniref:Transmembrane protein 066L n=1 Tax=Invertebrate iridescent virus 3 TaxID=345201 RepID=VF357_IIV3|nr:hypothetical protein MIV066L [Invertebrate iridescent virus 3]Q196Z4.1 RecName: Full=Transmembrane protein 066L [Invertebrate iridescent virus 3]ABF82096.1 hypothetical protein MIV066L [Invertebrate iridescent virus 3]
MTVTTASGQWTFPVLFATLLVGSALVFPVGGLVWSAIASLAIAYLYYLVVEQHPHVGFALQLLALVVVARAKSWWRQACSGSWLASIVRRRKPTLTVDEYRSTLTYWDPVNKKWYIYTFAHGQRSTDLLIFRDENKRDVTPLVEPLLGPLQNFHGASPTPADLGFARLHVFRDGETSYQRQFDRHEPLVLTPH